MKAKPIIDVDIIIDDYKCDLKKIISKLKKIGYIHLGEMGIPDRDAFKRTDTTTPHIGAKKEWFDHNLYVCKKESIALSNHLKLRNYLRENPNKAIEYSNLKQKLADKFPFDINSYVDGKTNFIVQVLNEKGVKTNEVTLIEKQNKLKAD